MNCGIILIETHLNDEEFLAYAGSEYILSRLINILKFTEQEKKVLDLKPYIMKQSVALNQQKFQHFVYFSSLTPTYMSDLKESV